jgi:AAA family ATP:ADP antiporter
VEKTIEFIQAIGYAENPRFYSFITAHFNNKNQEVIIAAIKAAGASSSPVFLSDLLGFLQQKELREDAMKAINNYGNAIIKELIFKLNYDQIQENSKQFIPEIIAGFGGQKAINGLFKLLRHKDLIVRLEAARTLNILKSKNPNLKFNKRDVVRLILQECKLYHKTLSAMQVQKQIFVKHEETITNDKDMEVFSARNSLIDLLERRLDHGLEQIFTLLGLRYQQKDIEIAYQGILSEKQEIRANALEFLDNLLQPNLKQVLLPLVEETTVLSSGEDLGQQDLLIPTEQQCFEMLLKGKDQKIKLSVLYLIAQFEGDKNYISLVKPLIEHQNKKINSFAKNALANLQKPQNY